MISNNIVSNNSQAINVGSTINCGTPSNEDETGINVGSSCVALKGITSYMNDETTP